MFTLEITGTGVSVVINPDSTKSLWCRQPDTSKSLSLKLTGKKDQFGTATVKLLVKDAGGLEASGNLKLLWPISASHKPSLPPIHRP
ncbi:MAG: hypothetical protein R2941_10115 [Desulfobacterales bacterium]